DAAPREGRHRLRRDRALPGVQGPQGRRRLIVRRMPDLHDLTEKLGVDIDPELLVVALTHRSHAFEHPGEVHNERLEFLGDAILGQAVTVMLFRRFPDLDEGELAKRRASLVSTLALAESARAIGL